MSEPNLIRCTERVSNDDYNHIECRFSDGQKFAAILVDKDFPELSKLVCDLLNAYASMDSKSKDNHHG